MGRPGPREYYILLRENKTSRGFGGELRKIGFLMSLMFDTERVRIRLQVCLESGLISKSLYEKYIGHLESIENQATN